ncbi:MAG: cell division protein FtsQ/DivIB [Roseinatronobacter sp.]|nr:cell division protein FtsQ/DivIB [Roseinatronobacter sp.]
MRQVVPQYSSRPDPAASAPADGWYGSDDDMPQAALSGAVSFWDHLGATRADEYAREDILPDVILPEPPQWTEQAGGAGAQAPRHLSLGDMSAIQGVSLDETLNPSDAYPPIPESAEGWSLQLAASRDYGTPNAFAPASPFAADHPGMGAAPFSAVHPARPRRATGRLAYRLQRIWLTPGYRISLKYGLPLLAVVGLIVLLLADEGRRGLISGQIETVKAAFMDRPEFMVTELQLPEMSPELEFALRQTLEIGLPVSSFRLDMDTLRAEVEALDWVRSADLRLLSGGVLALSVTERVPAILWRSDDGLELLDGEGVRVAFLLNRGLRPDLPLIAGAGANAHIPEALEVLDAAQPLGARVRGLVRMGERRWDVVLDRDQRIRLPEAAPVAALERVIALEQAQDLLSRDILVADMRNPARPVLQISAGAMETLRDIRSQSMEALQ